ncbi:transposase [candidate division WOR-3 bacterium]|nr:transposase [candidate division WOR-3 bacterium]
MSDINKKIPERKQLRLKGYEYSKPGGYFITICTEDRILNLKNRGIRGVVEGAWLKIPEHFDNVELDNYVIMPNHFHGIIRIVGVRFIEPETKKGVINHAPTLGEIIRWFKGRAKFEIGERYDKDFKWQRNYYDHIIRNENELAKVREYVINNPYRWNEDAENPENWKFAGKIDIAEYYRNIWE